MLSISPTYDVGESQGEAPCLDLEGALEALDSKYNSLLLESPLPGGAESPLSTCPLAPGTAST